MLHISSIIDRYINNNNQSGISEILGLLYHYYTDLAHIKRLSLASNFRTHDLTQNLVLSRVTIGQTPSFQLICTLDIGCANFFSNEKVRILLVNALPIALDSII